MHKDCAGRAWNATAVDMNPHLKPDVCKRVLVFALAVLLDDKHVVGPSPLCTHDPRSHPIANTWRGLEGNGRLVVRTCGCASWSMLPISLRPFDILVTTRRVVDGDTPCASFHIASIKSSAGSRATAHGHTSEQAPSGGLGVHCAILKLALAPARKGSALIRPREQAEPVRAQETRFRYAMPSHRRCPDTSACSWRSIRNDFTLHLRTQPFFGEHHW